MKLQLGSAYVAAFDLNSYMPVQIWNSSRSKIFQTKLAKYINVVFIRDTSCYNINITCI